jgi:phosphatidylserine synthase
MLGGVISAILCVVGHLIIYNFPVLTWDDLAVTVANRLLLGFVIGISCWRLHHLLHGAILGLIVSLSASIGFFPDHMLGFFLYTPAGILYGILIEWLSTDVFKSPMNKS